MKATAVAHPNIALIKYWGKRDKDLNLPAVGSISLTLDTIETRSTVVFREDLPEDRLLLNGETASPAQTQRVSRFLDLIRSKAKLDLRAEVSSTNNFPTGAGLASSASAFASLALAGSKAAGLELPPSRLSELARRGSGSAARSIFGGFVEMKTGELSDGTDAVAMPLDDAKGWDIRLVIAVTSHSEKKIGSTEGMEHTARTSPFYQHWVYQSQQDISAMRQAIFSRNFQLMGELAEYSAFKMHAVALSARPALLYWNSATVDLIHYIRNLREQGLPAYCTIDAGPQVKILVREADLQDLLEQLHHLRAVKEVIVTAPGPGARLITEEDD
ncbi:MAG: diphosphomevalonate decarboxylase [Calditrichia bacterium]